jgi:hypothetical protein
MLSLANLRLRICIFLSIAQVIERGSDYRFQNQNQNADKPQRTNVEDNEN